MRIAKCPIEIHISLGLLRGLHGGSVEMVVGGGACGDGKCGEPSI